MTEVNIEIIFHVTYYYLEKKGEKKDFSVAEKSVDSNYLSRDHNEPPRKLDKQCNWMKQSFTQFVHQLYYATLHALLMYIHMRTNTMEEF